ncbi:hypothetical protein SAMN05428948_3058 [Massilia sp. CF038]|nr:hypothetical protein SAMN05428948_3058 [Massilia sp. CF038]
MALVAAGLWFGAGPGEPGAVQAAAPLVPATAPRLLAQTGQEAPLSSAARATRLQELKQNFELVDRTYCDYAASTRYPHTSRPLAENPDQVYPNAPVTEANPMRTGGRNTDPSVQIQSSQSRVYMASGERVAFSVRAVDTKGAQLPMVITRAVAAGMTGQGQRATTQVALAFADDGSGADAVSGDGAFGGILAPAMTGLASFNGTIRTEVHFTVNGKAGFVLFDVIYTPELPAVWSGAPREGLEDGSLVYYLKADIRTVGRYLVSGRVDDASGKPFALASFNEVLPAGPNEIKLTVFGKLLRDAKPALPLTLRDVDGFLLKENVDPDRALMPRLEGKVLTGSKHLAGDFSDAEWQSEERTRHLDEFARDISLARRAMSEFDPSLPVLKSACLP